MATAQRFSICVIMGTCNSELSKKVYFCIKKGTLDYITPQSIGKPSILDVIINLVTQAQACCTRHQRSVGNIHFRRSSVRLSDDTMRGHPEA